MQHDESFINGDYSLTNQVRRHRPVWYNEKKDKYIYVTKNGYWHIASSEDYNAGLESRCWAYAKAYDNNGNLILPHYSKWTSGGKDISVTSSKHYWLCHFY